MGHTVAHLRIRTPHLPPTSATEWTKGIGVELTPQLQVPTNTITLFFLGAAPTPYMYVQVAILNLPHLYFIKYYHVHFKMHFNEVID